MIELPFLYDLQANLANNSNVILPVHQATIIWLKREQPVRVLATGRRTLLGTSLLERSQLTIQFTQPGLVTIEPI